MSSQLTCFFVSDLHGKTERYAKLFHTILQDPPDVVLLGGDLLPLREEDFIENYLIPKFAELKNQLGEDYPEVLAIFGNDDLKILEAGMREGEKAGLWIYLHGRKIEIGPYSFYGYSYVPPTPFRLKDWERYDVSRYADPGCVHPADGFHSTVFSESEVKYATIEKDLNELMGQADLSSAAILFHGPPHLTMLDRAALDGKLIDHVPVDVHVGSIAVRRFIETRKPLITLHGHIHESARITGSWQDRIENTWLFSAAHDGPELALVKFRMDEPHNAIRKLL